MPAAKRLTTDGPFSFCSYPFLLDPRAKSNLLHIEARHQMEQTVANARMEAQMHGGAARHVEEDQALVCVKQSLVKASPSKADGGGNGGGKTPRGSSASGGGGG
eukprot:342486-Chlamydomonas_euryale.AAC.1